MYLSEDEFALLANLPAKVLTKTRHSVPPFGIDVFDGVLTGLVRSSIRSETYSVGFRRDSTEFSARLLEHPNQFVGAGLQWRWLRHLPEC
jgi:hypothetical protein